MNIEHFSSVKCRDIPRGNKKYARGIDRMKDEDRNKR
jgi:hypothetical protein